MCPCVSSVMGSRWIVLSPKSWTGYILYDLLHCGVVPVMFPFVNLSLRPCRPVHRPCRDTIDIIYIISNWEVQLTRCCVSCQAAQLLGLVTEIQVWKFRTSVRNMSRILDFTYCQYAILYLNMAKSTVGYDCAFPCVESQCAHPEVICMSIVNCLSPHHTTRSSVNG